MMYPRVTLAVFSSLPRMNLTVTVSPMLCERTAKIMPSAEVIALPSTPVMMSPFSMPAAAAGLPSVTEMT